MEEIRGSKKFVPLYKEKEMIRKEAMKMGWTDGLKEGKKIGLERGIKKGKKEGLKEGEKKKAVEMAKTMKKEGEPLEKIKKYTGLSKVEIEKI